MSLVLDRKYGNSGVSISRRPGLADLAGASLKLKSQGVPGVNQETEQ